MTNSKATKKALFMSMLSLLLCFTMLMSATFAWFTDTVTSSNNRIKAGTLQVDILMDKLDRAGYVSIAEPEDDKARGDIFSEATGNGINWEPGKTEIVYLAVENTGSLALKYNILVDVEDERLAGSLKYAILDKATKADADAAGIASWADILTVEGVQTGDVLPGRTVAATNGSMPKETIDYFALAVHMDEQAGNEYQDKSIRIDVNVIATQLEAEEDSFGPEYDVDAEYPVIAMPVNTFEDLGELLSTGGSAVLTNGISATSTLTMNGGVLDGNGKTVTATATAGTGNATINPTGGTIKNLVLEGTGNTRSPYGIGSIQFSNTTLTEDMYIENVDVSKTRMAIDLNANGNSVYVKDCELANMIQIANQEEAVFENCHFYCDGTTPAMLGNGTNNIMLLGNMTFINCHFEENINFYVDDRCSGTIKFINCTYGNNGVEDRPFEPTVSFFTWWMEPQGISGYGGSFGDGDPGRTNFTCIVDDTTVWEATN